MAAPELLGHLGFRRRKFGSGDKELGYEIDGLPLSRLLLAVGLAAALLASLVGWSQYEIRLERRSFHRKLRREENAAAAQLAQVEMELWTHFRDDVRDSREALQLMDSLNSSLDELSVKLQTTIGKMARNFGLPQDKASILADTTVSLMAEQRQESIRHARGLLGHLLREGGGAEAAAGGSRRPGGGEGGLSPAARQEGELRELVGGFWQAHAAFQRHFAPARVKLVQGGGPLNKQLRDLRASLQGGELSGQEADAAQRRVADSLGLSLDHEDLAFLKSPADLLEVLLALPAFPTQELARLQSQWSPAPGSEGSGDPYALLSLLHDWRARGRLPAPWLEHALSFAGARPGPPPRAAA